ncbi:GHKL domain-containing protein [Streptococcus gordonii]|uniref:sensor histidine kinase n=1 Tax=Streptococcus gordonii TaxID=1302 RepID=UPI000E4B9A91|nr:GHKL domain-containing protein [Streptococcus gordonii]RHE63043.1 GHKL domain-containing protein [Streptococcus gordonii]
MGFLLIIIDFSILLLLHAKIYDYKITLKNYFLSTIAFSLFTLLFFILDINTIGLLLVYPIYFLIYTYFIDKGSSSRVLLVFYALFPITFWSVMYDFIIHFIVSNSKLLDFIYKSTYGVSFYSILASFMIFLLLKVFHYDFSYLKKITRDQKTNLTLFIANSTMYLYFVIIPIIGYIGIEKKISLNGYQEMLTALYFLLFICFVNILDRNLRRELQAQLLLQKEIQLQNINNYSSQIEGLYKDVRSFRHDYANILTSLKIGIDERDIDMITEVYYSVLKDSGKMLKGKRFEIARLGNIVDLSFKSLLLSKLSEAQNLSIPVFLEIEKPITIKNIDQLDFLTIVSILLDNAIEAATEVVTNADIEKSSDEGITVCFFENSKLNKQVLIIQNSTLKNEVDMTQIFERGVSSKGNGRGIGLSNIKKILKSYPNISLNTTSRDFIFRQILEIEF